MKRTLGLPLPVMEIATSCRHYWIIDECNYGCCKLCGTAKQFRAPSQVGQVIEFNRRRKRRSNDGKRIPRGGEWN